MVSEKKAIVLLSGGLDSTTTLYKAKADGFRITALSFQYGQRHQIELESAKKIAKMAGVESHILVTLDPVLFQGTALVDRDIQVPHDPSPENIIPITYVPARNTLFLAHALALAESIKAHHIFIGANAVDYSGYPDCRPEFLKAFETMANLGTKIGIEGNPIYIDAPLVDLTKADIIRLGISLGVDYSITLSCYDPDPSGKPCGLCDSCRLRQKGFEEAGLTDPAISR